MIRKQRELSIEERIVLLEQALDMNLREAAEMRRDIFLLRKEAQEKEKPSEG